MKKIVAAVSTVLLAAAVAACGAGGGTTPTAPADPPTGAAGSVEAESVELTLRYYVSDEDMSGLQEKTTTARLAQEADKYMAALRALQEADETAGEVSLWVDAEFRDAVLDEGTLTVDLSLPGEARFGAPGEALALEALQNTVFQFEEVTALDITVDGEQPDSLMGHIELEHPIHRSS